jgi:hypothetical protein
MLTSVLMLMHGYSRELRDPLRDQAHETRSNRMSMSQLRQPHSNQTRAAVAPWENQPVPHESSGRSFIIPDIDEDPALPPPGQETFEPLQGPPRSESARTTTIRKRSTGPGEMSEEQRMSTISFVTNSSTRSMPFMNDARVKRQSGRER